ncbi:Protein phosphatase 2C family protein [Rhynchospora pubera]|uniref:protein-serine/threonine phosphatase n=1 Tax=Rhynchospora pubera TaxID=906938 RepID=A0AAV8I0M7_9POAL|nr:Protein phosphatase 2C family protein [Rhynchospora pubera]
MGNGVAKLTRCFSCSSPPLRRRRRRRHVAPSDPAAALGLDDSPLQPQLGHSFCYVREDPSSFISISISGAAVSANASTPLSTSMVSDSSSSSSFESSVSFMSGPLPFSLTKDTKDTKDTEDDPFPISITTTHPSLQWAQGKAGEDRVHVVVSEQHAWVFVGIYDGFNGPDATHFLLTHLYPSIHLHLTHILCQQGHSQHTHNHKRPSTGTTPNNRSASNSKFSHVEVLKALSRALMKTEEAYLAMADNMLGQNPELALMGSCVLVMLMMRDDVYLMNVGDSRAVLATKSPTDLEGINQHLFNDFAGFLPSLSAVQLTFDHSTCAEEELIRIRNEHPDDSAVITNDRVKGSLKVTRAFGAGFLKQPKWNNALLEMFRIEYVGTAPYISCHPSLYHYRVGPKDRFLILSSDGLYQYLTNEEAVAQVEMFLSTSPDGDPAQHLVEEILFRAAAKAGMEVHELIEIPQGDRRRYYDDVSIIVISLEGRIWRSFV